MTVFQNISLLNLENMTLAGLFLAIHLTVEFPLSIYVLFFLNCGQCLLTKKEVGELVQFGTRNFQSKVL